MTIRNINNDDRALILGLVNERRHNVTKLQILKDRKQTCRDEIKDIIEEVKTLQRENANLSYLAIAKKFEEDGVTKRDVEELARARNRGRRKKGEH